MGSRSKSFRQKALTLALNAIGDTTAKQPIGATPSDVTPEERMAIIKQIDAQVFEISHPRKAAFVTKIQTKCTAGC